ncbi:gamma-glutamylcyclotransferase family protein [Mycoplasma phocoenae]|uniref:Gamma-glutamylcyclotransferase n=1 Tax=Mycoplasma phocoenae TaxID=754517 RepID=A0A858U459_9MOLU|nr:gamma-glutamylcyclotransferase family protein [Mycoplasma phocoenae]QJG67232.1 gamma-glutamylcyclotransferase [Mycoplasma phocoenae]
MNFKKNLFVYGTLKDEFFQKHIFNKKINTQKATLQGYSIINDDLNYLNIIEDKNGLIEGYLLKLTKKQLFFADLWESTPLYKKNKSESTNKKK